MFVWRVPMRSKIANGGVSYRLVRCTPVDPGNISQVGLAYSRTGVEQRVPKSHSKYLAAETRNRLAGQSPLRLPPDQSRQQDLVAERNGAEAEAV